MKRTFTGLLAATLTASMLVGCGTSSTAATTSSSTDSGSASTEEAKSYTLNVSGINGSLNFLPIYIAEQEGTLDAANITIEETLFTNGPVQMESLAADGWDIGFTGVGGVFAGVLGYDAVLLGSTNTDDGTQYIFARNDSDIVQAGTGHNTLSDKIYGTAETWKGKQILCNTGAVTQYVMNKTLEGFGLTGDDVAYVAMDPATAYSAFTAGEGDVCVLTGSGGTFKMEAQTDKYTAVSSGPLADSGLMCSIVANKNSYEDPEKREAMVALLKVYFETTAWMQEHPDETLKYALDYSDEAGNSMDEETEKNYITADTYYTLDEAVAMMKDKADGSDNTVIDQRLVDVLNFFIAAGSYDDGSVEKFLGHTDSSVLEEVQAAK